MTRRPYALLPRLAWIEKELGNATALLPMIIADIGEMRDAMDDASVRAIVVGSVAATGLLAVGVDARTLQAFVEAIGPEGDLDQAEELGAAILQQVMTLLADEQGQRH